MLFVIFSLNYQASVNPASLNSVKINQADPEMSHESANDLGSLVISQDSYTATAYCLRGRTVTGDYVKKGTIGVDPQYIPLGSKLYVAGYGFGIANDVGGAIKGKIIDIWLPSYDECIDWGRQTVTVYILKGGISEQEFLQSLSDDETKVVNEYGGSR